MRYFPIAGLDILTICLFYLVVRLVAKFLKKKPSLLYLIIFSIGLYVISGLVFYLFWSVGGASFLNRERLLFIFYWPFYLILLPMGGY